MRPRPDGHRHTSLCQLFLHRLGGACVSIPGSAATSRRHGARTVLSTLLRRIETRQSELLLVGSVLSAAVLLVGRLDQGWYSHDDGSLAHSAERILAGELPHRDFAELYTGLLSFLNAGVFAVFGHDIVNLRLPLLVLFLAFAGFFFALARRLVSPIWAFAATLFAISWSVPVYPAPLPSWYGLFLATIALYAVVRFIETGNRWWLTAAGACAGISIAIKIVGVYVALAVVLGLLVRPLLSDPAPGSRPARSAAYARIVTGVALFALAFVFAVMSGGLGLDEFVGLFLPLAMLCGAVAALGWRGEWLSGTQPRAVVGEVGAFLAGCAVPLVLLTVPYVMTGSLGDLLEGTLVAPRSRFKFASFDMPHPAALGWAVPLVVLFLARPRLAEVWRYRVDVAAGMCVIVLALTASSDRSYSALWDATRALAPFVLVLGAIVLLRRGALGSSRSVVAMVVLVAGFSTLVQFPFAAPVYFCYVAPLVLLAAIAGMRSLDLAGRLPAVVLLCLVVFGIRQLDRQALSSLGREFGADPQIAILDSERASIRVLPEDKRELDSVRELIVRHGAPGDPIFAGPDAPEVYFLTKSRNVTPSIMDFLDRSGTTRGSKLIALLQAYGIRLVVLNHKPGQSPDLAAGTIERIRGMYGSGERAGKFEVRWLAPPP
jgi:Dolichyl-phosphate-mannose-protein mannosyltransferase